MLGRKTHHFHDDKGYDFDYWTRNDHDGIINAHKAATLGELKVSYNSPLWKMRDNAGNTPAHFAVEWGYLDVDENSDLWYTKNDLG